MTDAGRRLPVVITIDTEPDNVWADHHSRRVRSVQELLTLQRLLDQFGSKCTLLVTYEITQHPEAVEVLERLRVGSGTEIGAHLHPWDNPPFLGTGLDRDHHTFPHELPLDVYSSKMELLTRTLANCFGPPVSYRAGRYGLSGAHLKVLEELGYRVETSVTPLCSWKNTLGLPRSLGGRGGIDYRRAPLEPYHPSYDDVTLPGNARILEIPVSIYATAGLSGPLVRGLAFLPERLQDAIRKLTGLSLVWARPTGFDPDDLVRMLQALLQTEPAVINIMFHSSELLLGGSPSTKTVEGVRATFNCMERMLRYLAGRPEVLFCTLSEAAQLIEAGRSGTSAPSYVSV